MGLNGPARSDTNLDGKLTSADALNPGAAGFELTGVDLGLALYLEQPATGAAAFAASPNSKCTCVLAVHATGALVSS